MGMAMRARGAFEVKLTPQATDDQPEGAPLSGQAQIRVVMAEEEPVLSA